MSTIIEIDVLAPGQSVVYFKGSSLARLRAKRQPDPQVAAADAAFRLAVEGRVDLIQRRCESGFQYLAVGRHAVDRQPVQPHYQEIAVRRPAA